MRKPFAIVGAFFAAAPQAAQAALIGFYGLDTSTPGLDAGRRA